MCAGSGASVLAGCQADLWITGEMSHHEVLDAVHGGTSVILCEHSNTERGYLKEFAKKLTGLLDNQVEVVVSEKDCDPLKIVWINSTTRIDRLRADWLRANWNSTLPCQGRP